MAARRRSMATSPGRDSTLLTVGFLWWWRKPRTSAYGSVSRVSPVQTALRNCTRDEGGPFGFGDQELIPRYRKLLWSKAMVVTGLHRTYISGIERGARNPTVLVIDHLAKALGVSPAMLLDEAKAR